MEFTLSKTAKLSLAYENPLHGFKLGLYRLSDKSRGSDGSLLNQFMMKRT